MVAEGMPDYNCICCIGGFVTGPLRGEVARCWCTCWLVAGLATLLGMAGCDGAVGYV